jgi:hypothetical protein
VIMPGVCFASGCRVDAQDDRRGLTPVILDQGDTVTFILKIALIPGAFRLILRCERDGTIQASLDRP